MSAIIPIAIGAGALALASSLRKKTKPAGGVIVFDDADEIVVTPGPGGPVGGGGSDLPPASEGRANLRYLAEQAGLPFDWSMFFEAVARGESGFHSYVGLGKPELFPDWTRPNTSASKKLQNNEANAAASAYDRNKKKLSKCPWSRSRYVFGSGGWFAMLPAFAVGAFSGTGYQCIDPYAVFDEPASLVMAQEMARRLMAWKNFKANPTWLNLRIGWGNPASMNKPSALERAARKFGDRLEQIGFDRSFMHRPVVSLPPKNPAAVVEYLWSIY